MGDDEAMKITWLGQAGLLFENENIKIIADPYLSDSIKKETPAKYRRTPINECLFDIKPEELLNGIITAKALDNRVGMAAVIAAGEKIAELNLPFKVILMFPSGEELGLRGARVGAFNCTAVSQISSGLTSRPRSVTIKP